MWNNGAEKEEPAAAGEPSCRADPCKYSSSGSSSSSEEEAVRERGPTVEPRWSMGAGKKDDWEKKARKMTLSHQPGWKEEMERSLHLSEGAEDHLGHSTRLLEQAMGMIKIALDSMKEKDEPYRDTFRLGNGAGPKPDILDLAEGTGEPAAVATAAATPRRVEAAARGGRRHKQRTRSIQTFPPLDVKFHGEPQRLGVFLTQVLNYMAEYGRDIPTDRARIRVVQAALDGVAADWVVGLYEADAPELLNFNQFMLSLRRRFGDPLAERKARERIKTVKQGRRPVAEYAQEFRTLASKLNWPEDILLSYFKDGLNYDLYDACLPRGDPHHLQDWYILAEEAEIDLTKRQRRGRRPWGKWPPESARVPAKQPSTSKRTIGCFKCGKEGHRAAVCRSRTPTGKPDRTLAGKSGKLPAKPKETAMKDTDTAEFPASARRGAYTAGASNSSDDDSEDEPLVDPMPTFLSMFP